MKVAYENSDQYSKSDNPSVAGIALRIAYTFSTKRDPIRHSIAGSGRYAKQ